MRPLDDDVALWCHLAVDPSKPITDGTPWRRADWGRVAAVDHATLAIDDQPSRSVELAELRGVAGSHRVIRWQGPPLAVGDLAIVCPAGAAPDAWLARLPPAWQSNLELTALVAPITAPPLVVEKAAFDPLHVPLAELAAAARTERWHLTTSRPVLARLSIGPALDGDRYTVPTDPPFVVTSSTPLTPGTRVWAILGDPRFESHQLVLTLRDADASYLTAAR